MEYFPGVIPEQPEDDKESKAEKKAKKDGKELAKKAALLELFHAPPEKAEMKLDENEKESEKEEVESAETGDEASAEQLDTAEQKVVAEQLVDDRLEAVETELATAPPGSDQEVSAASAAKFLEKLGAKIDGGEIIDDQALDEATAEAADELGIPLEEMGQADEIIEPVAPEIVGVGLAPEVEAAEDEPTAAIPTLPPPPTPPTSGTPGSAGSTPPPPSGRVSAFMPFSGGPAGMPSQPNILPPTPNVLPNIERSDRHSHFKYVLTGGLLGYLIGRRRGRIKTEERLLPVHKKLEKQVSDLQEKLFIREEAVRRLAIRHREDLQLKEREEIQKVVHRERAKRAETLKIYETAVHKKPERLGKFALLPNTSGEKPVTAEQLNERQLLEVAKSINLERTTLEALYRSGRIELADVRQIVQEFLSGGQYEKLLVKAVKPERFKDWTTSAELKPQIGATKVDQLLPYIPGLKQEEDLRFGTPQKETHLLAKVGIVAGAVTAVVVLAVVVVIWLLGAL